MSQVEIAGESYLLGLMGGERVAAVTWTALKKCGSTQVSGLSLSRREMAGHFQGSVSGFRFCGPGRFL